MYYIYLVAAFIIGTVAGSFLGVVTLRVENLKSMVTGRSICPECKHVLSWMDLVPVVSFLWLRGKCRYCGKKISAFYPLIEIGMGLVFLSLFWQFGLTLAFLYYIVVFSILAVIFMHDALTEEIPEVFSWIALGLALLGGWYFGGLTFLSVLYGALIGGGLLASFVIFSKETWMGAGDIKIGLILGLMLGYPNILFGLFAAFLLGSIVGIIKIKKRNQTLQDSLPFAPFLILGLFAAITWGQAIVNWYLWGRYY